MAPKYFYHGILQGNYRKMTIIWSFSYNFLVKLLWSFSYNFLVKLLWSFSYNAIVKLSLYNMIYFKWSTPMDPSQSVIKGL